MSTASYAEKADAEDPALRFLQRLGYQLLSPAQALAERDGRPRSVLLESILARKLRELNRFEYLGNTYEFSEASIQLAVQALRDIPDEGLVRTNERVYDLLTLGKNAPETVFGDTKSYTLRYIDWDIPARNDYHVVPQLLVQGAQHKRWPDLTLFVNGIPFAVIEAKRRDADHTLEEGIRQHIRNFDYEEGIPRLYHYAQLLLVLQPNEVRYGTTGAKPDFWSRWREEGMTEAALETAVQRLRLRPLPGLPPEPADTLPTEQDRQLYCLCRPERFLELTDRFTLFDGGVRKVARYQQYFAVRNTLERVRTRNPAATDDGPAARRGGIIWHTQGSGKSLTMVLLAKALALQPDIARPRVVLVTDRRDLDRQIRKTFQQCGKEVAPARSGQHLIELLQDRRADVITAIIDKFDTALRGRDFHDPDANIFVLIDESHRSQFGNRYQKMRRLLPHACYIGFTGTPLLKADRNTARRFGGFIDKYTIRQAVRDGAVLPLLYEGRALRFDINAQPLDRGVDRVTEPLPQYVAENVKKDNARRITHLFGSPQVIEEIAHDIAKHYTSTWQGTGLKAQLAVTSKRVAVLYHQAFQRLAKTNPALRVNAVVIISPPDRLPAADEDVNVYEEADQTGLVKRFWDETVTNSTYANAEAYEEDMIEKFNSSSDEVELLIVVSKLLTGFDAPRNTVLYLARHLQSHTLLQAIARVNRIFTGKQFGYIIDYAHLLGHLDQALSDYDELQGFDEEDLIGTVTNVDEEVEKLPDHHSAVWALFPRDINRLDLEALERHLAPADRRDEFRASLSRFARTLRLTLSVAVPPPHLNLDFYRRELALFSTLWRSVKVRYADDQDFREYEASIRKLLYTHVGVVDIESLGDPINIFDQSAEAASDPTAPAAAHASKADYIAHRLQKNISERLDQDPVLYEKFSRLLQAAINDFHQLRSTELDYLRQVQDISALVEQGFDAGIPPVLRPHPQARALFNSLRKALADVPAVAQPTSAQLADVALEIEQLMRTLLIRDWRRNADVQHQMHNTVEDYLLDHQVELGLAHLTSTDKYDLIDQLWDRTLEVARTNFE